MSCLRLSLKLPPARKAWKILTSKLQKKLPKFHRRPNKLITHNRTPRYHQTCAVGPSKVTVLVRPHGKNHLSSSNKPIKSRPHQPRLYAFKKRNAPMFVDKLFKEPTASTLSVTEVVNHKKTRVRQIENLAGAGPSDCEEKNMPVDPEDAGMTLGGVGGSGGDDDCMWESVGLASPLMHNIDERAEAFIAKFRAEMKHQEAMTRR